MVNNNTNRHPDGEKPQISSELYCTLTVDETVARLHTSPHKGLESHQDVSYRRGVHGPNELQHQEKESLVAKFFKTFYEDPLILLLLASAGISFLMGNWDDGISITLAITIVVTVGFVQEYRSEKSLEALAQLVPHYAHLIRGNQRSNVIANKLVPGDLITLSVGDRIPADVRLTMASDLEVDESNLTGETKPVRKTTDPVDPSQFGGQTIPITNRQCVGSMGTLVRNGKGEGIVVGTGNDTEFGAVFNMMNSIEKPRTPLQVTMDKLGKDLSLGSFCVIVLICFVGILQGRPWLDTFTIGVSLAVAAVPEGLPIIVTVTLALGVLRMAKRKAIVRRLPSVETLGCVNVVCTDKTGTLTLNRLTLTDIWAIGLNVTINVSDQAMPDSVVHSSDEYIKRMSQVCLICNDSQKVENGHWGGNPTDIAMRKFWTERLHKELGDSYQITDEKPFSSLNKYMAVWATENQSASQVFVKGAYEVVLKFCTKYIDSDNKVRSFDDQTRFKVEQQANAMSKDGLRIISLAYGDGKSFSSKSEDRPRDLVFTGLVGMYDPPRPGISESIHALNRGGVKVIMITGDSAATAMTIGKRIGMRLFGGEKAVMTGDELDSMSQEDLQRSLESVTIFARTSPEHKYKIVKALQANRDVVAMTGDGVNDAPALKIADIGISMGKMGTDVAKEASDMILTDDDFSTILHAIEEGKGIFYNIQNFLTFQLSTSIAALSLVSLATFAGLPNPLNAMQILWINILMDGPPAQSLGVESVDPQIMNRPPRKRSAQILTKEIIMRVLQSAAIIVVGTLIVFVKEMQDGQVTARDTTMTFTTFVLYDMFNALSCRSEGKSIFSLGIFSNSMFNLAVGGSLIGQFLAISLPFLQDIFQTESLSFRDIGIILLISSTVFIADEIRKILLSHNRSGTSALRTVNYSVNV